MARANGRAAEGPCCQASRHHGECRRDAPTATSPRCRASQLGYILLVNAPAECAAPWLAMSTRRHTHTPCAHGSSKRARRPCGPRPRPARQAHGLSRGARRPPRRGRRRYPQVRKTPRVATPCRREGMSLGRAVRTMRCPPRSSPSRAARRIRFLVVRKRVLGPEAPLLALTRRCTAEWLPVSLRIVSTASCRCSRSIRLVHAW